MCYKQLRAAPVLSHLRRATSLECGSRCALMPPWPRERTRCTLHAPARVSTHAWLQLACGRGHHAQPRCSTTARPSRRLQRCKR
jgi:hypothetical protein